MVFTASGCVSVSFLLCWGFDAGNTNPVPPALIADLKASADTLKIELDDSPAVGWNINGLPMGSSFFSIWVSKLYDLPSTFAGGAVSAASFFFSVSVTNGLKGNFSVLAIG